jgi:hypothetical protein
MVKFVGSHPWAAIEKDLKKPTRKPVIAVIAYVAADAPEMLHLRKGDALVCEASDKMIASAATNADALRRIRQRGVTVFSVQGLHAKVIASRDFAWVGSANASKSSQSLIEASVRIPRQDAGPIFEWAHDLCSEGAELTPADIRGKCAIKVKPRSGPLLPDTDDRQLPVDQPSLTILSLTRNDVKERVRRAAEKEESSVKGTFQAQRGRLDWILWPGDLSYGVAPGRWILGLLDGRPQRPEFVVRVSDHGAFKLVWTRTLTSGPSVRQADLADAMGSAWIQWDQDLEHARVIRGKDRVKAIFDLYRS